VYVAGMALAQVETSPETNREGKKRREPMGLGMAMGRQGDALGCFGHGAKRPMGLSTFSTFITFSTLGRPRKISAKNLPLSQLS